MRIIIPGEETHTTISNNSRRKITPRLPGAVPGIFSRGGRKILRKFFIQSVVKSAFPEIKSLNFSKFQVGCPTPPSTAASGYTISVIITKV